MEEEKINNYIQEELKKRNLDEATAIDAARWLDDANLLKDYKQRPGMNLRKLCRQKKIKHALKRGETKWFIQREDL